MTHSEEKIIQALRNAGDDSNEADTLHTVLLDMAGNQSIFLRLFPWIVMVGALVLAVFAATRFFHADSPEYWILYAAIFICDLLIMAIVKLWLYLCWVRNSILREIKRAELRLLLANDTKLKPQ